jgi:hypothetical protein
MKAATVFLQVLCGQSCSIAIVCLIASMLLAAGNLTNVPVYLV